LRFSPACCHVFIHAYSLPSRVTRWALCHELYVGLSTSFGRFGGEPNVLAARLILDRRLRMNAGAHSPEQIRSVRLRHAFVPAEAAIEIAVGRIAEQPSWTRDGGHAYAAATPLIENAVQYFVPTAAIVRHLQPRTSHSIAFHERSVPANPVLAVR